MQVTFHFRVIFPEVKNDLRKTNRTPTYPQHRVQLKKNTLGELNTTEKKNVRQREGTHMSDNFEKLIFWKFTGSTWLIILKIKTILIQNKERNKGKLENNMTLVLNWICFGHKTWKFSFSLFIIGSYLLKLLFLQDF